MTSYRKLASLLLFAAGILRLAGDTSAHAQASVRPVPAPLAPWQTDIYRFERELRDLVTTAHVPEQSALENRLEENSNDLEVITDGYGGVVDFNAAEGTVQYVANEMVQGRPIEWEFELAADAKPIYDKSIRLVPKFAPTQKDGDEAKNRPLLISIRVKESEAGPFKAGDRVRLKAYIDDFSRFKKGFSRATGLIAVHYLEDAPPAMFELRLEKAEISSAKPAE